jgi:DNA-binding LytR/AlgR family response regulator
MHTTKIIVIEDEFLVGEDIVSSLRHLNYDVAGPVPTTQEAIKVLSKESFDLALIDISLSGEQDGIALASYINREEQIPFIFLTAHDQERVVEKAKQVKPSAYLLKPFNARNVDIAIDIALNNFSKDIVSSGAVADFGPDKVLPIRDALFLKQNHRFLKVPFNDILWLKADGNYTEIYTSGQKYIQTIQLSKLAPYFPGHKFMRVHRSYVVNIDSVTGFEGNMLFVHDHCIPVSPAYREQIFQLFKMI